MCFIHQICLNPNHQSKITQLPKEIDLSEQLITLADLAPRFLVVVSLNEVETTGSGAGQRSTNRDVKSLQSNSRTTFVATAFSENISA